jgi:hypothetical protein
MENAKDTNVAVQAREAYEGKVAIEALERAGRCPQLKGHVHEILFKDGFNLSHIINGEHAALTKSNIAPMKDIVITKGGKVVGHMQLKDTVSNSGVRKTVQQIAEGKYGKTAVYGTTETTAKVGSKVAQKVHDSGISSNTTSRIASKALGKMPTTSMLGVAAKSGGAWGAAIGAGCEAVSSVVDVVNGKKEVSDAVVDVAAAGVKGGAIGAVSAVAGSAAAGVAGTATSVLVATSIGGAVAATGAGALAVAFAPVAIGFGAACLIGSAISSVFDD